MRHQATFLALTLASAALWMSGAAGQDSSPQKQAANAAKQQPTNETVARLLKTQLQSAQQVYRAATDSMEVRQVGDLLVLVKGDQHARPDLAYIWSVRWMHAQRDLSRTKDERTAAFADHYKRMQQLRAAVKTLVGDGSGGLLEASAAPAAEWYLAEAELWLLKERGK
jgi:hypothetical protein